MRITLTLDPDVAQLIADEAYRLRRPFDQIVNHAIRRGLGVGSGSRRTALKVKPHKTTLRAAADKGWTQQAR